MGGRRAAGTDARAHTEQFSSVLEVLLLGSFPAWFWLQDALEQPCLLVVWWLRCQGWAEESCGDPSWMLGVIYGGLGSSAGFAANHRCKEGELAHASQPSGTGGTGAGVIPPCAAHTGLLFPLASLQGTVAVSAPITGTSGRLGVAGLVTHAQGSSPQGLSLPVVPSWGGLGHVICIVMVPAGHLAQQGQAITHQLSPGQ